MKVTGLQVDVVWEDPAANRANLRPRIDAAVSAGARLVVLPEMFATGFSMAVDRVAEAVGGPNERFLIDAATQTGAAVCGSISQRPVSQRLGVGRPQNVFVLALPDGTVRRYAKIHPFSYGGEALHYDPGTEAITVTFEEVRITPIVCYDLRFGELFAATAERTDLFVVVANWPDVRVRHFTSLLESRAIETQSYVLGVNRIGSGGGLRFTGGSRLVSPQGAVISYANPDSPTPSNITGNVDPDEVSDVRGRFPFLADRRPDIYRQIRGDR